ncbi:hypothetical protein B296_00056274 [Ensete ventricosum]|uniref:Uncharacterized protein n=1 Tax=Ensete ventricosum TaxID=4639 RepID=A0A426X9R1_ENSVE|nr:hypothetical protein B296_00056274 [Ensete ventricosum]
MVSQYNQSFFLQFLLSDLLDAFETYIPQFLLNPNPLHPLNEEAADQMISNRSAYEQKVKGDIIFFVFSLSPQHVEHCQKYAKPEDVGVSEDKKLREEESDSKDEHY